MHSYMRVLSISLPPLAVAVARPHDFSSRNAILLESNLRTLRSPLGSHRFWETGSDRTSRRRFPKPRRTLATIVADRRVVPIQCPWVFSHDLVTADLYLPAMKILGDFSRATRISMLLLAWPATAGRSERRENASANAHAHVW